MKLNSLGTLRELESIGTIQSIKPMIYKRVTIDKSRLSEIELILYSTNLCLFSARILRDEIQVKNREGTLNAVTKEILKLYSILSTKDYYLHSDYTKQDTKKFFKDVGIRAEHLKH